VTGRCARSPFAEHGGKGPRGQVAEALGYGGDADPDGGGEGGDGDGEGSETAMQVTVVPESCQQAMPVPHEKSTQTPWSHVW
jgi:hypothetical protein